MNSVWKNNYDFKKRKSLHKDIEVETVVIGAGIAGLLTAYMLEEKGLDVIVIDAKEIVRGNTLNTTAKITLQHDLIYSKLIREFGEEKAKQYARANQLAIEKYNEIIKESHIDCDFENLPAYLYSLGSMDLLHEELNAAEKLGISAEIVKNVNLPFNVVGALKFNSQAQFNPIKFLKVISDKLTIYESTRAINIEEGLVTTNRGKIKTKNIIVTTHFPIMNTPGYYFLRMHQERSYVIALENADNVNGMYIDIDKNGYSFRNYKDLLLFGGMPHRTGKNEEGNSYEKLIDIAKILYPDSSVKYKWSAQDCMTIDGLPYIGRYSESSHNIYVATGFNKWGMSSSMVAAMILSDNIIGKENENADIFSPTRFDMSLSINNIIKDTVETAKNFIAQRVDIPNKELEHIQKGYGGIVEFEGEKVGVYKNEEGKSYIVTTKCPHLGCELKWNENDLSWDCPCHGSRFKYTGEILDSPANKRLVEE